MPEINAGLQPDIKALAKKAGVDPGVAEEIIQQTIQRLKKMQP
jgi:hypothetical protein